MSICDPSSNFISKSFTNSQSNYNRMKGFTFKLISIVLGMVIVVGLTYISLLGENNKAAKIVYMYIDNIAKKNYDANIQYCTQDYLKKFDTVNDPVTHQFSLEMALLKHFGLENSFKYSIEVERESLWIPFYGKNSVFVSVRINPEDMRSSYKELFFGEKKEFIHKLFFLKRVEGRWKIDQIDVGSRILANDYLETKNTMSSSEYVVQHENGVTIQEKELDFASLTPIQKRIITFNMNKVISLLNTGQ